MAHPLASLIRPNPGSATARAVVNRFALAALIVWLAVGCAAQNQTQTSSPRAGSSVEPTGGSAATADPGSTPASPDTGERPPSDWTDFLDRKVAAGEWSADEGVLHLLRSFVGAAPLPDGTALPQPIRGSATGIAQRAREQIAAGSGHASEIQALLNQLLPDRETLETISMPSASSSGIAVAGGWDDTLVAQPIPPECSPDVPLPDLDGGICLEYAERRAGTVSMRLYYPRAWHGDAERAPFFEFALEGAAHSIEVYTGLGLEAGPTVDIVFTNLPNFEHPTWMADASEVGSGCQVRVFPVAWENWRGAPDRSDRIRQVLAHELFHCFQAWNFPVAWAAASGWWSEGTAEFFSNVAYPAANAEYDFLADARQDPDQGIFARDYGNVFFFQHMANTDGIPAVMALLGSLPSTRDLGPQQEALASFLNMDAIFHSYAESLLDDRIDDQGQGPFPLEPRITNSLTLSGPGEIADFDLDPFVVYRVRSTFVEDNLYTLATDIDGEPQTTTRAGAVGGWSLPPESVPAGCAETSYVWAFTAVESGAGYTVEVLDATESECDPCLIGTWDLDNATYENFIPGNSELTYEGTSGRMYIFYGEDGTFVGGFDGFTTSTSQETEDFLTGDPVTQIVELIMNGRAAGSYRVGGGRVTIVRSDYAFDASVRIIYGGNVIARESIPFPGGSLPIVFDEPMPYTCGEHELRFTGTINERDFSPLVFNRSSEPLPTPTPQPTDAP